MTASNTSKGTMVILAEDFKGGKEEWNKLISSFDSYDAHQSWEWGEIFKTCGWTVKRIIFCKPGEIVSAGSFLVRKKFGFFICYCPRGPLLDYGNHESMQSVLQKASELFSGAICLKINPYILYDKDVCNKILSCGYFQTNRLDMYDRTLLIRLNVPQEHLEAELSANIRKQIRRASKKVEIKDCDIKRSIAEFLEIHGEMCQSKGLGPADTNFFMNVSDVFTGNDKLIFRAAFQCDKMVAAGFFMKNGNGTLLYKWGATSRKDGIESYASHVLIWDTVLMAKRQGFHWFDLGGIDSEKNSGVTMFKERFGGKEARLIGEYDYSGNKLLYKLI